MNRIILVLTFLISHMASAQVLNLPEHKINMNLLRKSIRLIGRDQDFKVLLADLAKINDAEFRVSITDGILSVNGKKNASFTFQRRKDGVEIVKKNGERWFEDHHLAFNENYARLRAFAQANEVSSFFEYIIPRAHAEGTFPFIPTFLAAYYIAEKIVPGPIGIGYIGSAFINAAADAATEKLKQKFESETVARILADDQAAISCTDKKTLLIASSVNRSKIQVKKEPEPPLDKNGKPAESWFTREEDMDKFLLSNEVGEQVRPSGEEFDLLKLMRAGCDAPNGVEAISEYLAARRAEARKARTEA